MAEVTTGNYSSPNRIAGDGGFKDKTLLITGGTGFLGKALIEKILRTCPLVKKIYVIVRPRKGNDPQIRMKEIFKGPLYDLLKKTRGEEILNKVIVISGDISEKGLGLSEENRKLLVEEVQIIFHVAATVRFEEPFKKAMLLNTRGTKLMLQLAKECKKLLVFAHVSTAYSHPEEKVLYEKAYPPPADPNKTIEIVEMLDEDCAQVVGTKLKGDCPNTYTFTKALAETHVNDEMDNLPVIILRPSVVVPIWRDPLPGWTDNMNGPMGLLIAGGKGVLRTMYCSPDKYADFISVDIAANAFMLATYDYMTNKERRIYNLTTSNHIHYTWKEVIDVGRELVTTEMPFNWVVWYPGGSPKSSRLHHNVCAILFHYIPAIILDSLIILTGNKPVLWRVQQRLSKGFEMFEYYTNNQWSFVNENTLKARDLLNETERKIYKVDEEGWDIRSYFYECMHFARLHLLKEGDETLPTAKRHMKIMWAVDRLCRILFWIGFGYLLLKYFVEPVLGTELY